MIDKIGMLKNIKSVYEIIDKHHKATEEAIDQIQSVFDDLPVPVQYKLQILINDWLTNEEAMMDTKAYLKGAEELLHVLEE